MDPAAPLRLSVQGVSKGYPGVQALDGVELKVSAGEIHALLGENGAGKSTLIGVLTGDIEADAGLIQLDGAPIQPKSPLAARRLGLSAVYQETNLPPNLSVADALYLGRQPTRFGIVQRRAMHRAASALLLRYGLDIDVRRALGDYSTAIQQLVAIARAVDLSAKVLILDEPTASLDAAETSLLFKVVRQLAADGLSVIFVTHFLDQVFALCDQITVLRNGKTVGELVVAKSTHRDVVSMMLGKSLADNALKRKARTAPGKVVAEFKAVGRKRMVAPFDLALRSGEIVGAAGLLGSGRTEAALLMYGAEALDSGEIKLAGKPVALWGPHDALKHGLGLCPENRKHDGILSELSIRDNIVVALQARSGWAKPISFRKRQALAQRYIERLDIRTPDADKPIGQLSGGNQQKALLARWLATDPKLLIIDEPTRGIDVGAHSEIIKLLEELCKTGLALFVISSEIDEVAAYSDRVVVMRERKMVGVLDGADISSEAILSAIAGAA